MPLSPEKVTIDFEVAAMKAYRESFQGIFILIFILNLFSLFVKYYFNLLFQLAITVKRCFFHFGQSLYKKFTRSKSSLFVGKLTFELLSVKFILTLINQSTILNSLIYLYIYCICLLFMCLFFTLNKLFTLNFKYNSLSLTRYQHCFSNHRLA